MGESNTARDCRAEDIIAAFDRERELAQELNRRHNEHVRSSRRDDRQVNNTERRHRPR